MRHTLFLFAVLSLALTAACGGKSKTKNNGDDASTTGDAATDGAIHDAAQDASLDAADEDAGPPCGIPLSATIDASLSISADDARVVYVNGELIDDDAYGWSQPMTYAIKLWKNPTRKNVIAIRGDNLYVQGGYDRGVIASIYTSGDDGPAFSVDTDAAWKLSTDEATNWTTVGFNDAAWEAPDLQVTNGSGPWGNIAGVAAGAHWLWSYDSSDVISKPTTETIYLRRSFYLGVNGTPVNTAVSCD